MTFQFVKQPGESWLVQTRAGGGNIEIADKDDALYNEVGLFVFHNDACKTTTFVPFHAIGTVRTWWKGGRVTEGSFRTAADLPLPEPNPLVIEAGVKELNE